MPLLSIHCGVFCHGVCSPIVKSYGVYFVRRVFLSNSVNSILLHAIYANIVRLSTLEFQDRLLAMTVECTGSTFLYVFFFVKQGHVNSL